MYGSLRAALGRLTLFCFPREALSGGQLGRSVWFYPLIGAAIGYMQVFAIRIIEGVGVGATELSAIAALLTVVFVSGVKHVDGLGRACDGLFDSGDRMRRLRLMGKRRRGTFGVVGIVLDLLVKWQLYVSAMGYGLEEWPVVVACRSRWSAVCAGCRAKVAEDADDGELIRNTGVVALLVSAIVPAGVAFHFYGNAAVPLMLVAALFPLPLRALARQRLGGMTGEMQHLAVELTEMALIFLLFFETILLPGG